MHTPFKTCYETFGNLCRPCIIFIMGIGGQLIHWPEKLIQGLVDQGFYVVTFDNRDAGLSRYYDHLETPSLAEVMRAKEEGKAISPPYMLEDMASDVIALMDELGVEQAHVVGMSMGGMIAQVVALDYPERVLSLTCIATTTSAPGLPSPKPQVLQFFFLKKLEENNLESYLANRIPLYQLYNHPDHFDEEQVRAMCIKSYERAYSPMGFHRQLLAIMCAKPRVERLKQLPIPTLIIHGDYDPAFPLEHGRQLAATLPNSHLEIIPKMGHALPECLCDRFVELMAGFYRILL